MNMPCEAPPTSNAVFFTDALPSGWAAGLSLGFSRRGEGTVLVRRHHFGPLRVQKTLYPEGPGIAHAIVLHPPSGIVGGDSLHIAVDVGAAAHALLTTPGAGKWYRSAGAWARQTVRVAVAERAVCEWLPQESLVYDGALGLTDVAFDVAPGAALIAADVLCLGRTARGEAFTHGEMRLATRLHLGGRLAWLERGVLAGGSDLLQSPLGLAGQPVCGTVLAAGPGVNEALRDACRQVVPAVGDAAVTLLPGVLVARYLGPACEPAQVWLRALWQVLRPAVAGVAAREPRIWRT